MSFISYLRLSLLFVILSLPLKASTIDTDDYDDSEAMLGSFPTILQHNIEKQSQKDPHTEEQTQNSERFSTQSLSLSTSKKRKLPLNKDDSPQSKKKQKSNNNNINSDPDSLLSISSQIQTFSNSEKVIEDQIVDVFSYESPKSHEELDPELATLLSSAFSAGSGDELEENTNIIVKKGAISKVNQFRVALLQQGKSINECLKEANLKRYNFKDKNFKGNIYLKIENIKIQPWVGLILESLESKDENLERAVSTNITKVDAAVIIIEINNRIFALPFGYGGRNLLNQETLEQDFGMKVALNTINPNRVKSYGSQTIGYNPRATFTSYNIPANVNCFIRETQEVMKKITAEVDGDDVTDSHMISGNGNFVTKNHKLVIDQLPNICKKLLTQFQSDSYKENYPWFDNIRPLIEKGIVKILEQDFQKVIKGETNGEWYLAKPYQENIDDTFDSYYKIEKNEFSTLKEVEDYIKKQKYTISTLRSKKVVAYDEFGEEKEAWSIYKLLVFEAKHNNKHYLLHEGQWFKLDPNYARDIDMYIDQLFLKENDHPQLALRGTKEKEEDYNSRVAASSNGHFLLFDQRLVRPSTNNHPTDIEVCDLLSRNQQLIHIKGDTHSSTLSHLFSQGKVSGFILNQDAEFRNRMKDKFLKEEIILKVKKIAKKWLKPIKEKWQQEMSGKEWEEQIKTLLKCDKVFGNLRSDIPFKKAEVEKSYNDKAKKSKTFKTSVSFDNYIFKFYKDYLYKILRTKLNPVSENALSLASKDKKAKYNNLIDACKLVFGEKLIKEPFRNELLTMCTDYQILLDDILPTDKFNPEKYTIVYGISTEKNEDKLSELIPFFSRVTLMAHAKELERIGYKVAVKKIEVK